MKLYQLIYFCHFIFNSFKVLHSTNYHTLFMDILGSFQLFTVISKAEIAI